jgi:hypothetical protein
MIYFPFRSKISFFRLNVSIYIKSKVCVFVCLFVCLLLGGGFFLRSVLRNREDLHFLKNLMTALMACVRLYSLYNFVCLSLCESDGCGPYRNHHRPPQRVLFVPRLLTFLEKLDYGSCCWAAAQQWGGLFFGVRSEDPLLGKCGVCLMAHVRLYYLYKDTSVCMCSGILFGVRSEAELLPPGTCLPSRFLGNVFK